jgi:hypothetical protein
MRAYLPYLFASIALVLGLVSCGPSDAEVELLRIQQEDSRQAYQKMLADSLANVESTIRRFEAEMDRMKGELVVAKDRLNRASEFKLLRTPAEREAQLQAATVEYERIKRWIEENEPSLRSWKDLRNQLRSQQER